MSEEKVPCRTPTAGRSGVVNLARWKFDPVRAAILKAVGDEGITFKDLPKAVAGLLDPALKTKLGSIGWHVTTVKLELERRGEIARVPGVSPQRLRRG